MYRFAGIKPKRAYTIMSKINGEILIIFAYLS